MESTVLRLPVLGIGVGIVLDPLAMMKDSSTTGVVLWFDVSTENESEGEYEKGEDGDEV